MCTTPFILLINDFFMEYYVLVYIIKYRKLLSKYLNLIFVSKYISIIWLLSETNTIYFEKNNSF